MTSGPVVLLTDVAKTYADQTVLHEVSMEVERGEFVAIVGPSGSGKSTLLNVVGGLDRRYRGSAQVCGLDLSKMSDAELSRFRNRKIGFVFQSFGLLDHLSALENVMLPACFGPRAGDDRGRATEALDCVGLASRADDLPHSLSGGQRQRVAIARALFSRPDILLADEPTGNLDSRTGQEIVELFTRLNQEKGLTLVVVTHEERVSRAAGRVVRLEDGRLARA